MWLPFYFSLLVLLCLNLPKLDAIQNKKIEKVYLEREVADDLEKSASGYMYRSDGRGPGTYVDLGGHALNRKQVAKYGLIKGPTKYAATTASKRQVPVKYRQQYQNTAPVQYVAAPQPVYIQPAHESPAQPVVVVSQPANPVQSQVVYPKPQYSSNYVVPVAQPIVPIQVVPAHQANSFEKGGGQKHDQAHYAKHGEKGDQGYDSQHQYDKGQKGSHGQEHHDGYYNEDTARKKGFDDAAGYYSKGDKASQGSKGESFHDSTSHKKGSKTEGFHKVYHKDEYKKDHTFYDESDKSGHHEKHGDEGSHHSSSSGGFKKGGNADAGFHHEEHGKKGFFDKGSFSKGDQGHKEASGAEKFHKEHSNFATDVGHSDGKQYGFSEKAGHHFRK